MCPSLSIGARRLASTRRRSPSGRRHDDIAAGLVVARSIPRHT
jgi:hypothetical protein